jgi:hypothetical protein
VERVSKQKGPSVQLMELIDREFQAAFDELERAFGQKKVGRNCATTWPFTDRPISSVTARYCRN